MQKQRWLRTSLDLAERNNEVRTALLSSTDVFASARVRVDMQFIVPVFEVFHLLVT